MSGRLAGAFVSLVVLAVACSSSDDHAIKLDSAPAATAPAATAPATTAPAATAPATTAASGTGASVPIASPATAAAPTSVVGADATITIDVTKPGATISPDILGVSSALTADELHQAGLTVNSWGGNPSTRYNYDIGHAWNAAADWEFRNGDYDNPGPDAALAYVESNQAAGVKTRMAIPTLGWVARNFDNNTCSFPDDGVCLSAAEVGNCQHVTVRADPTVANVPSTPETVGAWLQRMAAAGAVPEFVAMDNEPDLWGHTHYDVHPECPSYEEIADKYLSYATVVRTAMPDAKLLGPVLCCWFDYWNIAPGPADGSGQGFVGWFLDQIKAHDDASGTSTIDYLDVHFYPQTDVYNDNDDPETNARRLRSTRSLWDPDYTDESWIDTQIQFIPRMRETIAEHYPGLKLFISEWNFGNEGRINGALAIADVLGIYGREGVDAASYWRNPAVGSPGWYAFMMHGNYDGKGTRFDGTSVPAESSDVARIGSYAARDPSTGALRVMLINRDPDAAISVAVDVPGSTPAANSARYVYSPADLGRIVADTVPTASPVLLPASSITVLELEPQ